MEDLKNKKIFQKPNGFEESEGNFQKPKKPDNEDDNDNEADNDLKRKSKRKTFTPPTLKEIQDYVREKNLKVDAEQFYNYFTEGNWVDSKGNQVKSWKQKILTWSGYSKPINTDKKQFQKYDQRQYSNLNELYVNKK